MGLEKLLIVGIGIFAIILLAKSGIFSGIIKGFTQMMGGYGFIIGIAIVLIIVCGLLGLKGGK